MHSQVTAHNAEPVVLPGRHGAVGGLRRAGPGPLALLVPGYTGSKEDFAPLLDPLAEAGFDVLAIDLPGQMDSQGPDDETSYLPEHLGAFLAELIGKLAAEGKPVLLTGHSYGGLVSRRAVIAGAPVTGLTLLSSGPAALPPGPRRHMLDLGEPVMRERGVAEVHKIMQAINMQTPRYQAMAPEHREFLAARFLRNQGAALLGMGAGLRTEPDQVEVLAPVLAERGIPALVVCGEDDDAWPAVAQQEMAGRLGVPFELLQGAAHSPALENPAGLLAVLLSHWRAWLS
ncbi:alpha/beta fold hydrolase [Actinokineospora sp. G85]|uniref:alpha/beta fold hydrolase n=1 Tax=Actinokineospora sp. G85 TaxID=3406626 RepID=UPI003C74173C